MKLSVLGSGSAGNCYLFDDGDRILMVECGVKFADVKKAVDFRISRIVGAIVSHEHKDHAREAENVLKSKIPVGMSAGTAESLGIEPKTGVIVMRELDVYRFGEYRVQPFRTKHDAREPFGFLIYHPQMGMTLFATDTYYLSYTFAGLSNILIECNYALDILDANVAAGVVPEILRDRTIKSHCSLQTCREILKANDLTGVNNIVLIHLSDGNSDAVRFRDDISELTGKHIRIAEPGMCIDFDKTPF